MNGDDKRQSSSHIDDDTNDPGGKTSRRTDEELAEQERSVGKRHLVEMPTKNRPVVAEGLVEQLFTLLVKRIAGDTDLVGAQPRPHLTAHYNFVPQAQRRDLNRMDIRVSQNHTTPTRVFVLPVGRRRGMQ